MVLGCAFSPDGACIVSASYDNTLKLWNASSGQELRTLSGHTAGINRVAFSPDGTWIVSASVDRTIKVWDVATGEEKLTFPLVGSLGGLALHPWQPLAVCGDSGGNLFILDLVGISYGPIVSTAIRDNRGLMVRCPACLHQLQISENQLGSEVTCPTEGCGLQLKINPFVIHLDEK